LETGNYTRINSHGIYPAFDWKSQVNAMRQKVKEIKGTKAKSKEKTV
jgi:hypothetical protein